ncbi:hypothetical protein [Phytohabitans rumicis]|uniref:P3 N-terminal domain-containing protein n=1 Tax=Phytohabitans rumicis TaxID=1076125 RepID=A0A6V8L5F0_9ACTN|nr:hypothetical protein [Phytohabitans rumicis]GFJ92473.1 hypothetical protein Prum_061150 [Phytohabitans rumicis]
MVAATLTPSAPLIQGVSSPEVIVDPGAFYAATRRLRFPMRSLTAIAGLGSTDSTQLRQTGIVGMLEVRIKGTLTFGGTITGTSMTHEWPFNLVRAFRLSANGQSNLISARGLMVRALEYVTNPKIDDTGIAATFGSTAVTTGSLKMPADDWGTSGVNSLNPGATVAATGAYTVDVTYFIPVFAEPVTLIGAVYAQSSATNLSLDIDWNTQAALLTLGGSATLASALSYKVTGVAFSIPQVGGRFVVPDLSQFHQIAEFRQGGLAQGLNEPLLPGTGVGRKLLRLGFNVYSGSTPAPLALNDTNYSTVGWAYGGNDVPESYAAGGDLRAHNFRGSGVDLGGNWGIGMWDFASQFALRDVVDEGMTSDLRVQIGLVSSPTSGFAQIFQETLFAAPVGA